MGKNKSLKDKNAPFKNTALKDLKNEKWKDIPGLEEYFRVSNYGRVRRLEYEMQYKNGAVYIKPEKIIKPTVIHQKNKFMNDLNYFLVNRVTLDGIKYNLTLSRIVYYCFVEKFSLEDKTILILCKDGDGLNVIPKNLIKVTPSDRSRRTVNWGRFESPFKNLSPELRKKQRSAILKKISKQVSQYSLKGKRMRTFSSAAHAERATGVFATSIRTVASGKAISAGGYAWRWGKEKQVDVESLRQERKTMHRINYGQKVTQYDFNGNKIAQFPSLQDAHSATGVHETAIRLVIKGVYKSAKGFYWKSGYGNKKIDLSNYKWGRQSMAITQSKKVKQLTLDGKLVKIFSSIKDAAQAVRINATGIVEACKGRQKTAGGFKWMYAL